MEGTTESYERLALQTLDAIRYNSDGWEVREYLVIKAQVYATLALAASQPPQRFRQEVRDSKEHNLSLKAKTGQACCMQPYDGAIPEMRQMRCNRTPHEVEPNTGMWRHMVIDTDGTIRAVWTS